MTNWANRVVAVLCNDWNLLPAVQSCLFDYIGVHGREVRGTRNSYSIILWPRETIEALDQRTVPMHKALVCFLLFVKDVCVRGTWYCVKLIPEPMMIYVDMFAYYESGYHLSTFIYR